ERVGGSLALDGGNGDDPEQHRYVPVAERTYRPLRPLELRQGLERMLGTFVVPTEIEPPQARAQSQSDHGHGDERAVDGQLRGSEPDRNDGLSDRDDHDQAVALDEVGWSDQEAGGAVEGGRQPL